MANMQLLVRASAYSDSNPTNVPALQNFKWVRAINALSVDNPRSDAYEIAASGTVTVFTGGNAKRFVYLEASGSVTVAINGGAARTINQLIQSGGNFPAMFLSTESITSLVVANTGTDPVSIYIASAE